MTAVLFSLLIFYLPPTLAAGNQVNGKVVTVFDGNTLEVSSDDNERYKIILLGIDCPELGQEYGHEAASSLKKIMLGREVVVKLHGKDRSKNYIGVVLLKDSTDARIVLLDEGLAWTAEKDPIPELESHRLEAVRKKSGLWAADAPLPPWIYRRQQSMRTPKFR